MSKSVRIVWSVLCASACSSSTGPAYNPVLPVQWAIAVNNPFFPLVPGTTWQYRGPTGEGIETVTVEVLAEKRMVRGVSAVVVRDRVYLNGVLIEDTYDWYAQDPEGNVWYLGEDSKEMKNGAVVSTEGSWEWGVDGALPGIVMWADPAAHVGEEYRQEYYQGEAEDWGKVVAINQTMSVVYGNLTGCIKTEDWNAVDGGSGRELKHYCPQLGFVLETMKSGGSERLELISITRN